MCIPLLQLKFEINEGSRILIPEFYYFINKKVIAHFNNKIDADFIKN